MPASTYPHLLPPNATVLERALAGPLGRLNDLGVLPVPLDRLYRWDTCPAALLPWLAWAVSVDIWDEAWPEETKRNLIHESFDLHRKKGTLHTIGRYIHYAGGKLHRAITPPDRCYLGKSLTTEEMELWLSRFPQIRIFNFRGRTNPGHGAMVGGSTQRTPAMFLGAGVDGGPVTPTCFPLQAGAWEFYGRRAFLWDKGPHHLATGEETPLKWVEREIRNRLGVATTSEQMSIPTNNVPSLFLTGAQSVIGQLGSRRFLMPSSAAARIVTVAIQNTYAVEEDILRNRVSVGPGLTPINVTPKKVAERTLVKGAVFLGMTGHERWLDRQTGERKVIRGYVGGFLSPTRAGEHLYDRIDLHDSRRLPDGRATPTTFLGHTRLGMPAYTMQLDVEIPAKRPRSAAGRFVFGFLVKGDMTALENVRNAVLRAKSDRDKALLNTSLHRPPNTSDGFTTASGLRSDSTVFAL